RIEWTAAGSHDSRSPVGGDGAGEAQGRPESAGTDWRSDSGRGVDCCSGAESEAQERRPAPGDGGDEDAEYSVCADCGNGDPVVGYARAAGGGEGSAAGGGVRSRPQI